MIPFKSWLVEFLQDHDFEYERNIGESEVWRNNFSIMVIAPKVGIQLIYKLSMFTADYTKAVIEEDLKNYNQNTGSQLKNTSEQGVFLLPLDKCNTIVYNRVMNKDINKENLTEFIIFRVSESEKKEFIIKSKDSKNLSCYIRHLLKLDEETNQ